MSTIDSTYPYLMSTADNTKIYINKPKFIIGRGFQSSYVMDDHYISKTHCIFEKVNGVWFITDQSCNGIILNKTVILHRATCNISDGNIIKLPNGIEYLFVNKMQNNLLTSNTSQNKIQTNMNILTNSSTNIENHKNTCKRILQAAVSNNELDIRNSNSLSNIPGSSGINTRESSNKKRKLENIPNSSDINNCKSLNKKRKVEKENFDNLQCTICTELFIEATTLGCSHTFCSYCIETWKRRNGNCPVCRTQIYKTTPAKDLDRSIEKIINTSAMHIVKERKEIIKNREVSEPILFNAEDSFNTYSEENSYYSNSEEEDNDDEEEEEEEDSYNSYSAEVEVEEDIYSYSEEEEDPLSDSNTSSQSSESSDDTNDNSDNSEDDIYSRSSFTSHSYENSLLFEYEHEFEVYF